MENKYLLPVSVRVLLVFGAMLAFSGCAGMQADKWQPTERTLDLYTHYTLQVPDGYTYAGKAFTYARTEGVSPVVSIRDRFESYIFTQKNGQVLFLQVNRKFRKAYNFRFLGGDKVEIGGRKWRNADYVLPVDTTDREYREYMTWLKAKNIELPKQYNVSVQDKLASEFVLLRIMTFTPDVPEMAGVTGASDMADAMPKMKSVKEYADSESGTLVMPPYGELYDQERHADGDNDGYFLF